MGLDWVRKFLLEGFVEEILYIYYLYLDMYLKTRSYISCIMKSVLHKIQFGHYVL